MAQRNGYRNRQRPTPYSNSTWRENRQGPTAIKNEERPNTDNSDTSHQVTSDDKPRDGLIQLQDGGHREKKFANRARVYVGNLPRAMNEDELMSLFKPYGEITQVYLEKDKNFGFARMVSYYI